MLTYRGDSVNLALIQSLKPYVTIWFKAFLHSSCGDSRRRQIVGRADIENLKDTCPNSHDAVL